MIRVGILGGDTPGAGELIRILVNHPDVELMGVTSSKFRGTPLTSCHHGLVGETTLHFTEAINLDNLDLLFLADPSIDLSTMVDNYASDYAARVENGTAKPRKEELRIVDMTGYASGIEGMMFGLSEINRKPLVRGATRAYIAHPVASLTLVALGPMAMHLLLPEEVDIAVEAPADVITEDVLARAVAQIEEELPKIQKSFNGHANISSRQELSDDRGMRVRIQFRSNMSRSDVVDMFEKVYDDHNFTFITPMAMELKEVHGTNKCLLSVEADGNRVIIDAIADPRMRGGAGEAVHMLNLLFGLHEKTGLALRAL